MQHPLLSAFQYAARCLIRWQQKGATRAQQEQWARMVVEDSDPDGWIATAMLTAWGGGGE